MLDGVIYLIGGYTRTPAGAEQYLDHMYSLDVKGNINEADWQLAPLMSAKRTLAASAVRSLTLPGYPLA